MSDDNPAAPAFTEPSFFDSARRRKLLRKGRERGGSVYIPAHELEKAGHPFPADTYYRVWAGSRGRVVIQLYNEP